MFGAIHQHLKQYLIQNFFTHSRREGTITMIVLQCTVSLKQLSTTLGVQPKALLISCRKKFLVSG